MNPGCHGYTQFALRDWAALIRKNGSGDQRHRTASLKNTRACFDYATRTKNSLNEARRALIRTEAARIEGSTTNPDQTATSSGSAHEVSNRLSHYRRADEAVSAISCKNSSAWPSGSLTIKPRRGP